MIVAQQSTQSLAAPHPPLTMTVRVSRKQQDVALPLVIPRSMEMVDVFAERQPKRPLAEQDHPGQALLLD
jgi:hypothetical protein